jgi:hypothetical protein
LNNGLARATSPKLSVSHSFQLSVSFGFNNLAPNKAPRAAKTKIPPPTPVATPAIREALTSALIIKVALEVLGHSLCPRLKEAPGGQYLPVFPLSLTVTSTVYSPTLSPMKARVATYKLA